MSQKLNIVLDVGNSRIKSGIFLNNNLIHSEWFNDPDPLIQKYAGLGHHWIVSSVRKDISWMKDLKSEHLIILSHQTPVPLALDYETPETLGMDRLAAAVGAATIFPDKHVLIIDAGTCITYDLISKAGVFEGGVIAPGLKMRWKAMRQFTEKLPDLSDSWEEDITDGPGKSTRQSLFHGAFTAILIEIEGFISKFGQEKPDLLVLLTGGDSHYFESKLKQGIFADSNLVLKGLNRILNFNQ